MNYEDSARAEKKKLRKMTTKKIKDRLAERGHLNEWGRKQFKAELERRGSPYKAKKKRRSAPQDFFGGFGGGWG